MSSGGTGVSTAWGHLASILRVFRRRGARLQEFALFLDHLFGAGGVYSLTVVKCRHGPGEVHDAAQRNFSCCATAGSPDGNKAPKLVVQDVRSKAREFLASIGYGRIVSNHQQGNLAGQGGVGHAVIDDSEDEPEIESGNPIHPSGSAGRLGLAFSCSGYLDLGRELEQSPTQDHDGTRVSTGLRTYILTYLWGFKDDLTRLEAGICQISRSASSGRSEDWMLHLCGCGLSTVNGVRHGCVEPSHLVFGSQETNSKHTQYHATLRQLDGPGYDTVLPIMRTQCVDASRLL